MIIKSIDQKTGVCLATFTCHPPSPAKFVSICGDFNHWQPGVDTMTREPDGTFTHSLALKPGSRFAFKYLADVGGWLNDDKADDYTQNEYGEWNSVVATPAVPKKSIAKKAPTKKAAAKSALEKPTAAAKKSAPKKAPAPKKVAAKKAKPKS